ncbi:MAG: hypothetical protein AAGD92_06055 [Pseudomonadota bacterium]
MINKVFLIGLLFASVFIAPPPVVAQDTIVVTGSRAQRSFNNGGGGANPAVYVKKRASTVQFAARIFSNTLDRRSRNDELIAAVEKLYNRADRKDGLELFSIAGGADDYQSFDSGNGFYKGRDRFDRNEISSLIVEESFENNSTDEYAYIAVAYLSFEVTVKDDDALDGIRQSLDNMIESVLAGSRSQAVLSSASAVSVSNVQDSLGELRTKVIADAQSLAEVMGPETKYTISGLHAGVQWRQTKPLEFILYLPTSYSFSK